MDDRQFDGLTRMLAVGDTRRRLLRTALMAIPTMLAFLRGAETAARHSKTPLGGACRHTNQCLNHPASGRRVRRRPSRQAVYCDDNGFLYDGALNCCRYRGGSCQVDEHCCGSRYFCRNRVCTYRA